MVIIYTLSDPITLEVRYVGKTTKSLSRRLSGHIADAKLKRYKFHNTNWVQSLLVKGLLPVIAELDRTDDQDWEWLEQYWISQLRTWGFKLNNLTSGGDGNKGQVFSRESIEKRNAKNRGQKRSLEFRQMLSATFKGRLVSEDQKARIRQTVVGKQGRKVVQLDLVTGEFIREWPCIKEAADFCSVDKTSLARCCQGKFTKSAGYKWKYKEDYEGLKI